MRPDTFSTPLRLALAGIGGLALLAAFPPVDQGWVALGALVPFVLSLRGASPRAGALSGFVFGVAFFGVLLHWIAAFGVIAWTALVLLQAAIVALFGWFGARVAATGTLGRLAGLPALWAGVEMLRGRFPLGGFTWGGLGYSQVELGPMLPLARIGGVSLLGMAVFAFNVLVAEALVARAPRARATLAASGIALALLPLLAPIGLAGSASGSIDVAAVQGNVPRARMYTLARGRAGPEDGTIIENHVRVTEPLVGDAPDLVVWPENAFDRDPIRNPPLFEPVASLVRRVGAPFLIGAILDDGDHFVNATLFVDPAGAIRDRYEKVHLVPFGEYVPFAFARKIVPVLDEEIPVNGRPGDRLVVFDVGGTRVGSVICFESSYPELVRSVVRDGAEVLVVTTNNASFGTSPASRQHVATSRMRAVETGRAIVHAAISGISSIIGPDGRVEQRSDLFVPALLRAQLPTTRAQTPYARYGSAIEIAIGVAALAAAAAGFAARRGKEGEV